MENKENILTIQEDNSDELNNTLTEESQTENHLNEIYNSKSRVTDDKDHKSELTARLIAAEKKIKQSEKQIYEISVDELKNDNISRNNHQFIPKYIEEDAKCVIVYVQEYIKKLEEQLNDLDNADQQVFIQKSKSNQVSLIN